MEPPPGATWLSQLWGSPRPTPSMRMQGCRGSLLLQALEEGQCPFPHSPAFPSGVTPLDEWDPQTYKYIHPGGLGPKGTQTSAWVAI